MNKTTLMTVITVIFIGFIIFLKDGGDKVEYKSLDEDATILAFGDSLTYGFGASDGSSYPDVMQRKTGLHIINAGVNGETTSESLHRLPIYLEHQPDFVILCIGGNDILQNVPEQTIKENILKMIDLIKQSGAEMMLVGVPELNTLGFKVLGIYKDIADEKGVLLEDDILSYIELRRELKSDYIHPNAKGYKMMADAFVEVLRENNIIK